MHSKLTYRLFRDSDLSGVIQLWTEESGWGGLTPDVWRQWYVDTPHGPSLVVVAVDEDDEIVGQMVFAPVVVCVDNKNIRALRISAPILRKTLNLGAARSMSHPVNQLFLSGVAAAAAQGFQLVYSLPDQHWLPLFEWSARFDILRFAVARYPGMVVAIDPGAASTDGAEGFIARKVTAFGSAYETLWDSARQAFPIQCGVVRSAGRLQYKHGGHLTLEMRDPVGNTLAGYAAIKRESGLLVDLLARSPADLSLVITATLRWLATERAAASADSLDNLKAMATPVLGPALHNLGFAPLEYTFAFVTKSLSSSLPDEAIAPDRWYLMPTD